MEKPQAPKLRQSKTIEAYTKAQLIKGMEKYYKDVKANPARYYDVSTKPELTTKENAKRTIDALIDFITINN